ncbi:MAG: AAA family ATPase [Bacteroidales bacterium]|nr:AAA family ATPase [Bacteroidales bacterium]
MIKELKLNNFGPISDFSCNSLENINLIIGPNQSGKTILLKAIYASLKTVEQYKRGNEFRSDKEILADKLHWLFQAEQIGNLVTKGRSKLAFELKMAGGKSFSYSFGPSTTKSIIALQNEIDGKDVNSVFIPAKEVLSIRNIILDSKDRYSLFGFDDSYVDLAKLLSNPTTKGRNYKAFSDARDSLKDMVGGRLDYDESRQDWVFKDNNRKEFEISLTSEGVKKLSILDILLGNHYLTNRSVIIIDEIEANLHPSMISKFLEIIRILADAGIQFFIASHSYFVIKRLYLMAHQHSMNIPVISFGQEECGVGNLKKAMPKNPIIDESIQLYKEEIML